ncbi:protease inhibitor I42 family protein [Carboxylicivirga sediminis]|nr:protease inhibitor I42 family protein [Carboxylicivirga sediminis]
MFSLTYLGCNSKGSNSINRVDYDIEVGELFQVELNANRTTGYSWKWMNSESISIVDSIDLSYKPDTSALVGSGGAEIWIFKGMKPGIDSLKFEYSRPWEQNSVSKSKVVTIRVK